MKNIKTLRKLKNISQLQLSIAIGVSQELISKYERGNAYPSINVLIKIADYFNCSVDYILEKTTYTYSINSLLYLSNINDADKEILIKYNSLTKEQKLKLEGAYLAITK
ncbi:MAG: helix-turn-helix transcriptional regulator [Clostridia bacterium]